MTRRWVFLDALTEQDEEDLKDVDLEKELMLIRSRIHADFPSFTRSKIEPKQIKIDKDEEGQISIWSEAMFTYMGLGYMWRAGISAYIQRWPGGDTERIGGILDSLNVTKNYWHCATALDQADSKQEEV